MSLHGFPSFQYFNVTVPAEYVVLVEINRPKKLNAFSLPMWSEMKTIFTLLSSHPDVRCVLLCSAGERAFTAGLDVVETTESGSLTGGALTDPSRKAFSTRAHVLELQECVTSIADCNKPVIALLHGITYGLGIDLATACDIRLCAQNTRFCIKEVDIGLAADVGTLSRLPKVLGGITSWGKEVAFTAREFTPEEAVHNNFVSRAVAGGKNELIQEGIKLAQLVSKKSPVAVQGTKNILDAAWGRTVADNLNYTAIWNAAMIQSSDVERAMLSSLKKRVPTFEKL